LQQIITVERGYANSHVDLSRLLAHAIGESYGILSTLIRVMSSSMIRLKSSSVKNSLWQSLHLITTQSYHPGAVFFPNWFLLRRRDVGSSVALACVRAVSAVAASQRESESDRRSVVVAPRVRPLKEYVTKSCKAPSIEHPLTSK